MGLELAEQFGWELPDWIVYPLGGGTGIVGMRKAFAELEQLGLIGPKRPRFVAVQAAGCAPIVRAWEAGRGGGGALGESGHQGLGAAGAAGARRLPRPASALHETERPGHRGGRVAARRPSPPGSPPTRGCGSAPKAPPRSPRSRIWRPPERSSRASGWWCSRPAIPPTMSDDVRFEMPVRHLRGGDAGDVQAFLDEMVRRLAPCVGGRACGGRARSRSRRRRARPGRACRRRPRPASTTPRSPSRSWRRSPWSLDAAGVLPLGARIGDVWPRGASAAGPAPALRPPPPPLGAGGVDAALSSLPVPGRSRGADRPRRAGRRSPRRPGGHVQRSRVHPLGPDRRARHRDAAGGAAPRARPRAAGVGWSGGGAGGAAGSRRVPDGDRPGGEAGGEAGASTVPDLGPPPLGRPQDGNGRFLAGLGEICGHAGLFGGARDLWRLGAEWLAPGRLLHPESVAARPGGRWPRSPSAGGGGRSAAARGGRSRPPPSVTPVSQATVSGSTRTGAGCFVLLGSRIDPFDRHESLAPALPPGGVGAGE